MIKDNIKNYKTYVSVHKDFEKVFEFLNKLDSNTKPGKYVIEEDRVWVNVSESEHDENAERQYEAHRDFIDVHYIISGGEKFGCSEIDKLKETVPYDKENDLIFLDGELNSLFLKKGDFIVTFPQDAHIPAMNKISDDILVRAVAKINIVEKGN